MRKRERFFVLLLALLPQILWAQMSVVTYNQSAKQVLLCTTNQRHNIDTLYVVDEKDINTVCFANDGTVTEMTNSLGTLKFEYDDDCVDVTYHVDGQLLSRHVYHYADTEEYRQFRQQTAEWQGKMDTDNIVVNFLNSKAFQATYEFQDNLFDNLGNPAKAMYDNVIKPAVYGDKTEMNGIDQAVDDIIGVVLKCAVPKDLLMEKTVDKWLKNPKETFDGFVSSLHDWLFKNYELQKQHNDYEMAWRQGLREKVMRNEITMEEATAKVSEVIEKKKEFIRNNSVDPIFDQVAVVTSKDENGEEKYDYQVYGGINEVGVPLEALQAPREGELSVVWNNIKKYTESTTYGELESVTIYYFYLKSDDVKWDYAKRNGKLELTHHHSERPEGSEKREYPFYKVDLYYVNNKDKNNWGSVKIRLWLSPSGRIINVYTFDCRGKQGEFTPGKSIGDDWLNFNVAY